MNPGKQLQMKAEKLLRAIFKGIKEGEFITIDWFLGKRRYYRSVDEIDFEEIYHLNRSGAGVYFAVNCTNGKGRDKSTINRVNAVFIDIDLKNFLDGETTIDAVLARIKKISPIPFHFVVSSGHGLHFYWLVKEFPINKFTDFQRRLIHYFKSDTAIKDLPRVMRLPGTINLKDPLNSKICEVIYQNEGLPHYSFKQIQKAFPDPAPVKEDKINIPKIDFNYLSIPLKREIEVLDKLYFISPLTNKFRGAVLSASKGNRSDADTAYAKHLGSLLFSEELICYEIQTKSQKYNDGDLRGKHKESYLNDKLSQNSHIRELLSYPMFVGAGGSCEVSTTTSLTSNSKRDIRAIEAILVPHPKIGRIDSNLKNWLQNEFIHLPQNTQLCICIRPGGGKSNLIKQIGALFLNDIESNFKRLTENNVLIVMERIKDGLLLEQVLDNLQIATYYYHFKKLSEIKTQALKEFQINKTKEDEEDEFFLRAGEKTIDSFLDQSEAKSVKELVANSYKLESITHPKDGKIVFKPVKEKSKEVCFTCSANEDVCLKDLPSKKINHETCRKCNESNCPAHPSRKASRRESPISIITHQSILSASSKSDIWKAPNNKKRNLLLIDEAPDVLKIYEVLVSGINGRITKTSLNPLLMKLESSGRLELAKHIKDQLLTRLKRIYSEAHRAYLKIESDIYKTANFPKLNKSTIDELKDFEKEVRKKANQDDLYKITSLVETITNLSGMEVICTFNKDQDNNHHLDIRFAVNLWKKVNPGNTKSLIFDATAYLSPIYALEGAPQVLRLDNPEDINFPNLNLKFYTERDIHRGKINNEYIDQLLTDIHDAHSDKKVLIVTSKEHESDVNKIIQEKAFNGMTCEHFGNLKGKNEFVDCKVIAFTNLWRRKDLDYLLMAQEIKKKNGGQLELPKQWQVKKGEMSKRGNSPLTNYYGRTIVFNDPFIEAVRTSWEAHDLIQNIYRTALRRDLTEEVTVYVPAVSPGIVKKIIEAFPGAKCTKTNG